MSISINHSSKYRADIDGLRAIAVLLVLVFHFRLVPGGDVGFIGVDIFFVISGYLITGILFSYLEQGRFTFSEFYVRRIRRLAGETSVVASHLTRRSLLGAATMLCVVWVSGVIVSHPMPAAGAHAHAAHCEHPGEGAFSHLFCRGGLLAREPESSRAQPGGAGTGDVAPACPHAHNAA